MRHQIIRVILVVLGVFLAWSPLTAGEASKPNVILILADDLGWGDLGCYGQKKIRTPNLDKLAAGGIRFTQFYAGCPVCAPSRCVLMTGKHTGHAYIRTNKEVQPEGQEPIPEETVTLSRLLKNAGYATACIGKWGLGPVGSSGDPLKHGFDLFFGCNCQRHAHNFYPTYVRKNDQKLPLEGNTGGVTGKQYIHDLMEDEALAFIKENKARPFFLYLPFTIPHLALQVPEDSLAEYKGQWEDPPYQGGKGYQPHPAPRGAYAAMITRMDRSVGRIVELLQQLKLDENTVILFSSDNGAVFPGIGGSDPLFFNSTGGLRGFKGSVYEGGLRVPLIVAWKGHIPPGRTSDLPAASYDLLPTLCDLTRTKAPQDIDGLSLVPTLLGQGTQPRHTYLYWEFFGGGGQQSVRMGDWKAVRQNIHKGNLKIELYNLAKDPLQASDVAAENPEVMKRIEQILVEAHTPSKLFAFKALDK